ncbi:MAG: FxLYD domain-containing protein [Terriglobia bacterium]
MNQTDESRSFPVIPLAVAGVLGIALLIGILWLGRAESERPSLPAKLPPLEGEEARYAEEQIKLEPVSLSRWENFLGQVVTYVDGTVENTGSRRVIALELTVEFLDIFGQVVLRERIRPIGRVSQRTFPAPPLKPGERRAYRAGVEHIPTEWNRGAPRITITGLLLK